MPLPADIDVQNHPPGSRCYLAFFVHLRIFANPFVRLQSRRKSRIESTPCKQEVADSCILSSRPRIVYRAQPACNRRGALGLGQAELVGDLDLAGEPELVLELDLPG